MNGYLAENRHRIQIIGKIPVNDSVQFLDVSHQAWGRGFPFICNLRAPVEATRWVSGNYSNQELGGSLLDANSITHVTWGASTNPRPDYLTWSHVNKRAAQRRVHDDFLCRRSQEILWRHCNWRNHLVNHWVHCRYNDRYGPVTQYFFFDIPVAIVSNCLRIACRIALCVPCGRCVLFMIFGVVGCQILYCVCRLVQFI